MEGGIEGVEQTPTGKGAVDGHNLHNPATRVHNCYSQHINSLKTIPNSCIHFLHVLNACIFMGRCKNTLLHYVLLRVGSLNLPLSKNFTS